MQPKKGRGKEKLRCLRRKKKSVEKVTGRSSPFEGWFCAVPWGGGRSPSQTPGRKTLSPHPATPHPALWPQPSPRKAASGPPSDCLCMGIALIHCLSARMEFTFLLADLRCLHPQPHPRPCFRSPGRSGWVGAQSPQQLFCPQS